MGYCQEYVSTPVVRTEKASREPMLNLSALPPGEKQRVWKAIKEESPGLASLLTDMGEPASHFGGTLLVEHKHLPRRVLEIIGENHD